MEELKDISIHHTAIKLSDEIQKMESYKDLYNEIQVNCKLARKCLYIL